MNEGILHHTSIGPQPGNNAAWYRASTLRERIPCGVMPSSPNTEAYQIAEDYLRDWKQQTPFDEDGWFAERLAMDDITEEDLLKLLAESDTELQKCLYDLPD